MRLSSPLAVLSSALDSSSNDSFVRCSNFSTREESEGMLPEGYFRLGTIYFPQVSLATALTAMLQACFKYIIPEKIREPQRTRRSLQFEEISNL
jgi:hypothetical protein